MVFRCQKKELCKSECVKGLPSVHKAHEDTSCSVHHVCKV